MSDIQQSLGIPHTFKHKDKTYSVGHLTQEIKGKFEEWLKTEARKALFELKPLLPPAEWRDELRLLNKEIVAGDYAFFGLVSASALGTPSGSLKIAALLFGCGQEEMDRLATERGEEVAALVRQILEESGMKAEPAEGNVQPPGKKE